MSKFAGLGRALSDAVWALSQWREAGTRTRRRRASIGALRRYLLYSSGIAMTALGLAITGSFLAVIYAAAADEPPSVHEFTDRVQSMAYMTLVEPSPEVAAEPLSVEAVEALPPQQAIDAFTVATAPASADLETSPGMRIEGVNLTFYDCLNQGFCGAMYNGRRVYEGAAACSWDLKIGTRFRILGDPTQRVYTCADRGMLTATWVDIFWHDPADGWKWQASVGRSGTIEIVQ